MTTAITPAELAARDLARADRAANLADLAVRLWDALDAVAQSGKLPGRRRHVHLPAVRSCDGVLVLDWAADPWAMTACLGLPGLAGDRHPTGAVELRAATRDWAARGDSCVVRPRDPDAAVAEEFWPTLDHFGTDNNVTPTMIAGFRRDVERAVRDGDRSVPASPPAMSGELGPMPLRNPAEQLTPDDWQVVPMPVIPSTVPPPSPAGSPGMPLAEPDAYAARAADIERVVPIARRVVKASRAEIVALAKTKAAAGSLLGGLLSGVLVKVIVALLPMLVDWIVDALEAGKTPQAGGGGPVWPSGPAMPLNPAVAKAMQEIRVGKPEPE